MQDNGNLGRFLERMAQQKLKVGLGTTEKDG